jgi:hypothetical protein
MLPPRCESRGSPRDADANWKASQKIIARLINFSLDIHNRSPVGFRAISAWIRRGGGGTLSSVCDPSLLLFLKCEWIAPAPGTMPG